MDISYPSPPFTGHPFQRVTSFPHPPPYLNMELGRTPKEPVLGLGLTIGRIQLEKADEEEESESEDNSEREDEDDDEIVSDLSLELIVLVI